MVEEMKMDVIEHVEKVTTITFKDKEVIQNVMECLKQLNETFWDAH